MTTAYQLTFSDYLLIARRRAVLLATTFFGILAVALVVTVSIPPTYESAGTIMIESQQISTDLVPTMVTSYVDERIEIIRQRVITREHLLKIIEKYGLFKDDEKSLTTSEKFDDMRKRILVERISANIAGKRNTQSTIAFKLTFEHRRPEIAYRVANELVTLFLDENVRLRTDRASETTDFLTKEANAIKTKLDEVESQLATYKQENAGALPENSQLRMASIQRAETELRDTEREYKATQEEARFLEVQLAAAKAGVGTAAPSPGSAKLLSPEQELAQLKIEYGRLGATYNEAHPDVRYVKNRIERLEKTLATATKSSAATPTVSSAADLPVLQIQSKIDSANNRLASLAQQQRALRGRISQMEGQSLQSPQVERGMAALMRDHANAQKKYDEVRAKQMNAQMAENLEEGNKAERFSLIDPPLMPDRPAKPNRLKILMIGIFMAFAGSGGLAFVLEMLNQRIRGADALTAAIKHRPIAVIPYIVTFEETGIREKRRNQVLKGLAIATPVILLLVHFLYMPLDILALKIIARFG